MDFKAINLPASYVRQSWFNNGTPYGAPIGGFQGSAYFKRGTSSGMVKGDRKAPNAFSYSFQEGGDVTGSFTLHEPNYYSIQSGCITQAESANVAFSLINASDPYNKALDKLYSSLRSDTDLSIDLYQGGQTVKMLLDLGKAIASPINTLARAMTGLVKSHKVKRGSDLLANKWLEWQYGIKPTMATIQQLTGEMVELVSDSSGFYVAKARASSIDDVSGFYKVGALLSAFPCHAHVTDSRRVEVCMHYTVDSPTLNALSQFTSVNPVSFVYENIPFSFVLDWAVDVGGYLRMLETACLTGLKFQSGYVSTSRRVSSVINIDCVRIPTTVGQRYYSAKGSGWYQATAFNRSLLRTMPHPQLPSLKVNLGSQRLLSAASLLRGFLR